MNPSNSKNATKLYLSLVRDTLFDSFDSDVSALAQSHIHAHCALWLESGQITINQKPLATGQAAELSHTDKVLTIGSQPAVILRFIASIEPIQNSPITEPSIYNCNTLFTQSIHVDTDEILMRLDQVDFPPAAIAYKHTHPGAGIRYLVEGGLTLVSDHGEQQIEAGTAWFEAANSAVEATAISTAPSQFIRMMLLPLAYEGRSTFTLCNAADKDKPRLQTNIRHMEKRIVIAVSH